MLARVGVAVLGWVVFGSLVEARRDRLHQDDPVVVAVVEAELASRNCRGLANDVAQIKQVSERHGMNHADFFTRKQSAAFKARLAALDRDLRADHEATCRDLWALYGEAGSRARLLKRS